MKAAITAAVTTFAQTAGAWRDRDTTTIEQLRRGLATANRTIEQRNRSIVRIAIALGLPPSADVDAIVQHIAGLP